MAYYPWDMLRQVEILARGNRENPIPAVKERLRELFEACSQAPEAHEAIAYHGALALLHEFEGNIQDAVKARETEIRKIERLHEILAEDPPDVQVFLLEQYSVQDLVARREILAELRSRL